MFSFLKKKEEGIWITAPLKGKAVEITQVKDPTFGECMLGKGVAILPEEGKVYAPADGEISMMFDTHHAVSMVTDEGVEILIHIGLDTVELKGEGFEPHVKSQDRVKKGDLLLTVDLDKIKAAGYDIISPVVICNTDDYKEVEGMPAQEVGLQDAVIRILK